MHRSHLVHEICPTQAFVLQHDQGQNVICHCGNCVFLGTDGRPTSLVLVSMLNFQPKLWSTFACLQCNKELMYLADKPDNVQNLLYTCNCGVDSIMNLVVINNLDWQFSWWMFQHSDAVMTASCKDLSSKIKFNIHQNCQVSILPHKRPLSSCRNAYSNSGFAGAEERDSHRSCMQMFVINPHFMDWSSDNPRNGFFPSTEPLKSLQSFANLFGFRFAALTEPGCSPCANLNGSWLFIAKKKKMFLGRFYRRYFQILLNPNVWITFLKKSLLFASKLWMFAFWGNCFVCTVCHMQKGLLSCGSVLVVNGHPSCWVFYR